MSRRLKNASFWVLVILCIFLVLLLAILAEVILRRPSPTQF
jgi:hypothetical protein